MNSYSIYISNNWRSKTHSHIIEPQPETGAPDTALRPSLSHPSFIPLQQRGAQCVRLFAQRLPSRLVLDSRI